MATTNPAYDIVTSKSLTHEQKMMQLSKVGENTLNVLNIPERTQYYFDIGAINDLFEGHAPYRPRYIMPSYDKFIENGSEFLDIKPPQDFDELLFSLMTLYRHVPSITNFPVYIGRLDMLIDPFIKDLSDEEVTKKLRLFMTYLDRTITDSFCHANLGPEDTRAGRLIMQTAAELQNAVPNLTVLYDPDVTTDEFMELAIASSLVCANPAICNHKANDGFYEGEYGISSCYNVLPVGGGSYTLTRITLTKLAEVADSPKHFMEDVLPEALTLMADYINERVNFIVEKSNFFESNFLVKEGLISKDRFVPMFGVTGLAEAVNTLLADKDQVYGRDQEADDFGEEILIAIRDQVDSMRTVHSPITDNHFVLHAQVGLESDLGITSGVRIPVGGEPESFIQHLTHSGRYHKYFPAGVGDIFPIASNVDQNPAALLDVVKGAFSGGVHYMSFYSADSDLVRITGYLVKRSEIEKYFNDEVVLQNTTQLGAPNYEVNRLADRKVRMV